MTKAISSRMSALQRVPGEIRFFLDDPPLWPGENRAEYMALLAAIGASCQAGKDPLKWLLVNEVTHQVWEMRRFRRIESVETIIAKCENRRRATLLEIDRRDEAFARRLAQASTDILDAEFSEAAE